MEFWCAAIFNESLTFKLNGTAIRNCHIELAFVACHLIFSVVCFVVLLVLHARARKQKTVCVSRFKEHVFRWIANFLLILVLLCEIGDVCLSEVQRSSIRFLFVANPFLGMLAAFSGLLYYDSIETRNLGIYLVWTAVYWFLVGAGNIVKLVQLYDSGLTGEHLLVDCTWAAIVIYFVLFATETSIICNQCHLPKRIVHFNAVQQEDISGVGYLHPFSNLLSRSVFFWVNPLLRLGAKRPLELADLGKLPEEELAENHLEKFAEIYLSEKEKLQPNQGSCPNLWKCYLLAFWQKHSLAAVFRILSDTVSFVGSLSIGVIVTYAATIPQTGEVSTDVQEDHHVTWREFFQNGYVMAVVVLIATLAQSLFQQAFMHTVIVEGIHLRAAIQSFIYKKALKQPAWVSGVDGQDAGSIVNYITTDAYNIMMMFFMGHYTWAMPLKIVILLVLLYHQLGYSALLGAASMLLLIPLQYFVGSFMSKNQKHLLGAADERLRKTNEILQGIRQLKLYAWEFVFSKSITTAREKELKLLLKDHIFWTLNSFLTDTSTVLVSLVTFAVYSLIEGKPLTAADVFPGLALFSQLAVPMFLFPITIPVVVSALVSTKRLTKFLETIESSTEDFTCDTAPARATSTIVIPSSDGSMFVLNSNPEEDDEASENADNEALKNQRLSQYLSDDLREDDDKFTTAAIRLTSTSFAWKDKAILEKISAVVEKGKLTVVVGSVGSGKTSFLLSLLGEMKLMSGTVKLENDGAIAYVPQKPWLLNATIMENILFGRKLVTSWYNSVLSACALLADLDILPQGDQTEIGERGVTLSGGQKQRIVLARALYCKAKLLILDDPTSALDAQVSLHVFENAILNLVRKHHRTVILVTNRIQFLSEANQIIVIDGGRIKHQGTFQDIVRLDPDLSEAWMATMKTEEKEGELPEEATSTSKERRQLLRLVSIHGGVTQGPQENRKVFARGISFTRQMSCCDAMSPVPLNECGDEECPFTFEEGGGAYSLNRHSSVSAALSTSSLKISFQRMISTITSASEVPSEDPVVQDTTDKLIVSEQRERGKIKAGLYWKYVKSCGYPYFTLFVVLSVLSRCVGVFRDFWLSDWSEAAGSNDTVAPEVLNSIMDKYLTGYAMLCVSGIVLTLLSSLTGLFSGYRALRALHSGMLDSVIRAPVRFFDTNPVGRILNRFSSDIGVIDRKLQITIQTLVHFVLLCFSAVVVNAIITPFFLAITIPVIIIYYIIQRYFRFSSRELQRLDSLTKSPIVSHVSETFVGLVTIRTFREEKRFRKKMLQLINTNSNCFLMMNCANRWLGIALDFLGGVIVFLATVTAITVALEGHISPAFIGLAVSYTLLVPVYLNWVVRHLSDLEMYMSGVERVDQYSNLVSEDYDGRKAPPDGWPTSGAILFENTSLRYDSSLEPVISNLTLTIRPGEKVGVCGRTGSGKSSLALALFQMTECFDGRVSIDGVELRSLPLLLSRSSLSIIPQEAALFSGTLRWNLDPFGVHSDDEIWRSLELAQMKNSISTMPDMLDAQVAEDGENFSAGQKQLLCLARAILCPSKILVMDEATATLDEGLDTILQDVFATSFADRTVITIAHHVSTIMNYDTIVVLDRGKILEYGSPQKLLQLPNGEFASLVRTSRGK